MVEASEDEHRLAGGVPPPAAWLGAAGGILLTALTAAIPLANEGAPHAGAVAALNAVTVLSLIGIGLFAWIRDPESRFGGLLVAAGFLSVLVSLSASGAELPYSVGRVALWVRELLLVFVFLSYPTGRLPGRAERIVVSAAIVTLLTLYLLPALLTDGFPRFPVFCSRGCPGNAFQVVGSEPGLVGSVLVPLRQGITAVIFLAAAGLIFLRLRRATPLTRKGLALILSVAIGRTLAIIGILAGQVSGNTAVTTASDWIALLAVPAAALSFLFGLFLWRLFSAQTLRHLALDSTEPTDREGLQRRLAEMLDDPSLEVRYAVPSDPPSWRDAHGRPALVPATPERCVVEVTDEGEPIAAIVCDPALSEQRDLLDAAATWLRTILVRQRLTDALNASVRDIEASRRRIATAAAAERRRIERDLHDGAQQHLVTLRVKLELIEEELERDPARGAELLRELGPRIDSVIEEVRSLASGIYPSLLADAGVVEALHAVARRNEVPATVTADGIGSYPLEIETAIYFCCLEALQNAGKHAQASAISIVLESDDGELSFEVRDDGVGFDPDSMIGGSGLTNMRDRLAALGGDVSVHSAPGRGTAVAGRVPLPGSNGARADGHRDGLATSPPWPLGAVPPARSAKARPRLREE
jgi:signal transduction histidine kinase